MELTLDEAKAAQGMIMSEAHRLSTGRVSSEAVKAAAEMVARQHFNGATGDELHRAIGNVVGGLSGSGRPPTKPPERVVEASEQPRPKTFSALYRKWVEENDIIPDDKALEYFTGNSNPSYLRSEMRKEGYDFEPIDWGKGAGYRVTARPKRTAEDVSRELAEAISTNQQVRAVSLIMELMGLMNKAK